MHAVLTSCRPTGCRQHDQQLDLSCPILSYPILLNPGPIPSHPVRSHPVLSDPIRSYPFSCFPILSYPLRSYPILSYLSVRQSVCPFITIYFCLSVCLSVGLSDSLSKYLSVLLPFRPSIYQPPYPPILSILSVCLSVFILSRCLPMSLGAYYLFIFLQLCINFCGAVLILVSLQQPFRHFGHVGSLWLWRGGNFGVARTTFLSLCACRIAPLNGRSTKKLMVQFLFRERKPRLSFQASGLK